MDSQIDPQDLTNLAFDGRWRVEFDGGVPQDPSGNDFVLKDGALTLARSGTGAGEYRVEGGSLILDIPMPAIDGEGPWEMSLRFYAGEGSGSAAVLPGVAHASNSSGPLANMTCRLVRLQADA